MAIRLTLILIGLLMSLPAQANAVWPALYLETRLFSWWAIGFGLIVEFIFIRTIFVLTLRQALWADFAANAASALLGVVLIPLAGIAWEVFPGLVFYHFFNMGTFNPFTWTATFILACLINALLESYVLKRYFKLQTTRRTFFWMVLANVFSVGIAFGSLWLKPVYS